MNTCQHFQPYTFTTDTHPYNFGQCKKIIAYREKGGSVQKTEEIIRTRLNGALKTDTGHYLVTGCDDDMGCEFFAP